jgi:hypothetical protein
MVNIIADFLGTQVQCKCTILLPAIVGLRKIADHSSSNIPVDCVSLAVTSVLGMEVEVGSGSRFACPGLLFN